MILRAVMMFSIVSASLSNAGSEVGIDSGAFKDAGTLFYGKILEVESNYVLRIESNTREAARADAERKHKEFILPYEVAAAYLWMQPDEHLKSLWSAAEGSEPSEKEIAEAERKDILLEKKIEEEWEKAMERSGLKQQLDEEEYLRVYRVGTAKVKVVEVYSGKLTEGKTVELVWDEKFRIACPPLLPEAVGSGSVWASKQEATDGRITSFAGYWADQKMARAAKAKYEKELMDLMELTTKTEETDQSAQKPDSE